MTRSDYSIVQLTAHKVFIRDENLGRMSVTNDAENVVREVWLKYPNRRIIYQDSDGRWDELVHHSGVFFDFAPYNEGTP